ncbi:hypothetical protein FRB93_002109 [Tulasnella sp. JGI-2019a]|nr:hypothetical protein FRB93_002109 [Tulasnella sp. JGI-2019a]
MRLPSLTHFPAYIRRRSIPVATPWQAYYRPDYVTDPSCFDGVGPPYIAAQCNLSAHRVSTLGLFDAIAPFPPIPFKDGTTTGFDIPIEEFGRRLWMLYFTFPGPSDPPSIQPIPVDTHTTGTTTQSTTMVATPSDDTLDTFSHAQDVELGNGNYEVEWRRLELFPVISHLNEIPSAMNEITSDMTLDDGVLRGPLPFADFLSPPAQFLSQDPIPHRPRHPLPQTDSRPKGPVRYYCVHDGGRKCRAKAPFHFKKAFYIEHLMSASGNYMHYCQHCGRGSNRWSNLKRHYKTCPVLNQTARLAHRCVLKNRTADLLPPQSAVLFHQPSPRLPHDNNLLTRLQSSSASEESRH